MSTATSLLSLVRSLVFPLILLASFFGTATQAPAQVITHESLPGSQVTGYQTNTNGFVDSYTVKDNANNSITVNVDSPDATKSTDIVNAYNETHPTGTITSKVKKVVNGPTTTYYYEGFIRGV